MKRLFASLLLSFFFGLVHCLSPTYISCQLQKPSGESPLKGCPQGTLYVSPSGSGANFSSVQEAINSLPETGHSFILIGEGRYFEQVTVTRSAALTLLGQLDPATASIQNGNASQRNLVYIWSSNRADGNITDEGSATLTVGPTYGYSFGNVDFRVYNINFENLAANYSISPALVTCITLANVSFYGCAFASYQDTWYTGYGANSYVVDSIVYGQTDYVFGCGLAWFQSVTLANRACGGAITAWGGESEFQAGVYISNSRIIRSPDASPSAVTNGQCSLGRPWSQFSVAVFLHTYMDDSIAPAGFKPWNAESIPNTTYYAELGSYGPGGSTSARVSQDHILSTQDAKNFTLKNVFGGAPKWVDSGYKY